MAIRERDRNNNKTAKRNKIINKKLYGVDRQNTQQKTQQRI